MTRKQNFEDAINHLEEIVEKFQSGDLTIDNMIKNYEEGVKLAKFCLKKLEEAENKISQLNIDNSINESDDISEND